ncbi:tRNA (guanine(26)-N(2))-dimethyltransferase protein [Dioscorea alata]|uniref:tRNA (Guanine(26)-N(2))-dimethyltransferase protein n=1 Tax=Dioscorea alata TaxID=55571 RepID=A0ACB7WN52_DIOAL|nr:tRNA (guanine(26)-N(2))-dimethyltransferase protein [Dioscorea alata]
MRFIVGKAFKLPRKPSKSNLSFFSSAQNSERSNLALEIEGCRVIKEGEAQILLDDSNGVFCNKAQVNNRDMSIAVLRTFIAKRKEEHASKFCRENVNDPLKSPSVKEHQELKEPMVLEALAASGLRAIRYAQEVEGIGQVIALDSDKASVDACKRNIQFNGSVASSKVEVHLVDARVYMLTHPKEFDVVDIDPYGSPSIFLDSAVQSVADGGMLMCTATDMAVLCGDDREVCYSKYGSYPLKGKYCHEMALRILLASIESHANRYKRHIVPVLSVYMDFYIRVFVRIFTSGSAMKETPLKLSYVYQCVGCDSFHLQCLGRTFTKNNNVRYAPAFGPLVDKECGDCGRKFTIGGPIWSAPIHNHDWVVSTLSNVIAMKNRYPAYDRISAVLTTISEELPDAPLFLNLHNLSATVKCDSPSALMLRSAVINAGYRISGTHITPLGLKSDAPMYAIWDIMRCWVKTRKVKDQPSDQPGAAILSKEPTLQVNFKKAVGAISKAQANNIARFLPKPEKNWGPKIRAGRRIIDTKHASLLGCKNIVTDDTGS